jgi:hypothetical protein
MKHLIYKEGNDSMTNWEENEIKEFLQIKENEKKERKSDFLATSGFTFLYIGKKPFPILKAFLIFLFV